MTKIFVGGSRHITKINDPIKERLLNIISKKYFVIIGDANGADKAVQFFLLEKNYSNVAIYCSGSSCRNNLGNWKRINVEVPTKVKGRKFYMVKDLKMSEDGDYGFMIWDGKSAGTINNILNLLERDKISVVYFSPTAKIYTIKNTDSLELLLKQCDDKSIEAIDKKISFKKKLSKIKKPNQVQMVLEI